MAKAPAPPADPRRIQQVAVLETLRAGALTPAHAVDHEQNRRDAAAVSAAVGDYFPPVFHRVLGASLMYFPPERLRRMAELQGALTRAVVDVVSRWWDDGGRLARRMPLHPAEERILMWMDSPEGRATVPPFQSHMGCWRPDFVVAKGDRLRVCEINARVAYNPHMLIPRLLDGLGELGLGRDADSVLMPAVDTKALHAALIAQFDSSRPLHVLHEHHDDAGETVRFARHFSAVTGQPMRVIKPGDLRLVGGRGGDSAPAEGHRLFCVINDDDDDDNKEAPGGEGDSGETPAAMDGTFRSAETGELLEPVHQTAIELEQWELRAIPLPVLQALAPNCVNDLRAALLVNDQRLLGVLCEELPGQVARGVLSAGEAEMLRDDGLALSHLAGGEGWRGVEGRSRADAREKDGWVLKGARAASGFGHVFGHQVDNDEWLRQLARAAAAPGDGLLSPSSSSDSSGAEDDGDEGGMGDGASAAAAVAQAGGEEEEKEKEKKKPSNYNSEDSFECVLQRVVEPQEDYTFVFHDREGEEVFHVVGAWYVVEGRFYGFAVARLANVVQLKILHGEPQMPMAGVTLREG